MFHSCSRNPEKKTLRKQRRTCLLLKKTYTWTIRKAKVRVGTMTEEVDKTHGGSTTVFQLGMLWVSKTPLTELHRETVCDGTWGRTSLYDQSGWASLTEAFQITLLLKSKAAGENTFSLDKTGRSGLTCSNTNLKNNIRENELENS